MWKIVFFYERSMSALKIILIRKNIFTRDISTQAFLDLAPSGTLHIKLELKRTEQEYEKCPIDKVDSRYVTYLGRY